MEDNEELLKVIREQTARTQYRHSYPAFRVHRLDKTNPYYYLEGKKFNEKLKEIVHSNLKSAEIIREFDYGLGGLKNLLIQIEHKDYYWFFAIDIFNVVLLNLICKYDIKENASLHQLCIPDLKYSHSLNHQGKNFLVCNTNHAFENYKKLKSNLTLDEVTNNFWEDFEKYVWNYEQSGHFDLLQIGDIIIICEYSNEKSDLTSEYCG